MNSEPCPPEIDLWPEVVGEPSRWGVFRHVSRCPACRRRIAEARRKMRVLRDLGASFAADPRVDDRELPAEIGDYPILGVIGQGGQSVVYRGLHPRLLTEIAIKRMRPSVDFSESALVHEAMILSAVRSSALPRALDLKQVGGEWFLFLELIHGEPLTTCGERMDGRQIVRLLRELLIAMAELHASQLLHLDLTPANVLIDENGNARLIDFGLARRLSVDDEQMRFGGTPGFVAPEVLEPAAKVDERADIFGAGAVLHFLLHGEAPLEAETSRRPVRPELDSDPLAARLQSVCECSTQRDPRRRFQSADEFLKALDEIERRPTSSRRWLIAGALAGALVLGQQPRLIETAHAEVLVVAPAGERPLRDTPQLRLGDQIAFAFDAAAASAGLLVRLPSGRVVRLEPFKRSPAGPFRYPPDGGTVLRQERGTYVVFFAPEGVEAAKTRLQDILEHLPAPPAVGRGETRFFSSSVQRDESPLQDRGRSWTEAFLRCEREFPGLVAIAFPVE